jgi:hypothetical protein
MDPIIGRKKMSVKDAEKQFQVSGADEEMDIDDYEIVGAEFFAQIKEPAFTVNVNKVTANAASVRLLADTDYVKMLIKPDEKKLVLKPCREDDIYGYKWARTKDGKRFASQRTGEPFVLILCDIMNWNPDNRYKILGKRMYSKGEAILVFDLTVAQCFEKTASNGEGKPGKRSALPAGWNGKFGPTFGENRRTLQVDTFEGYTVFTIKGTKGTTGENTEAKVEKTELLEKKDQERDVGPITPNERIEVEDGGQFVFSDGRM